jgi:tetratricopeptide (TPR) repeat protein
VPLERLTLTATQGFILSRIDGNTTLGDIIAILPPEEEERAVRFVFALLVMGVLEHDPPVGEGGFRVGDIVRGHEDQRETEREQEQSILEQYARVRGQNHYEVLGIGSAAGRQEVARAYEDLKLRFGRDRVLPRVREKFRAELALIESRMIEAYLTLSQPDRAALKVAPDEDSAQREDQPLHDLAVRVEVDRAKSKVEMDNANRVADSYYAKGRKCMRDGDYHGGIQYGKLAISHNPQDARYFCLLADCQARNPEHRWQRMAEANYVTATRLDPWNWHYWVCLGRLYKKRGMKLRARKQFEEALKLVPNKNEVLNELTGLD